MWTLSILLAAGLMLILWGIAEPASWYFHEPRVVWLVRILALRTLIAGFSNAVLWRSAVICASIANSPISCCSACPRRWSPLGSLSGCGTGVRLLSASWALH